MTDATIIAICKKFTKDSIADLGDVFDWIGVTTTALSDGSTANPITVNGESVTVKAGDVAQYNNTEFVFGKDGKWQEFSENVSVEDGCIIFG